MTNALLSSVLLLAGPGALQSEVAERGAFKAEVGALLDKRDYRALELLGEQLIKDDPRYACGVSKLVDFYWALEPSKPAVPDEIRGRETLFIEWDQQRPRSYWPKVGLSIVESARAWAARGQR